MSQGFNPGRHTVNRGQALRWSLFKEAAGKDFIPSHPEVLSVLIEALRGRIRRMDRTKDRRFAEIRIPLKDDIAGLRRAVRTLVARIKKLDRTMRKELAGRVRLYIAAISQRVRWPEELEENWLYRSSLGHYDDLFKDELRAIERGRLVNFSCLPSVLRLQRDLLYEFMARREPDGYSTKDTPKEWLERNHKRLYGELTHYGCTCTYHQDLLEISSVMIHDETPPIRKSKRKKPHSLRRSDLGGSAQESNPEWVSEEWPWRRTLSTIFKKPTELNPDIRAALDSKGPGEMIPAILSGLHSGPSSSSIRQILKKSARRPKIPPFLA